ncbi:MAG: antibiotic biosynthesis monooxygenase [Wenzhouxiangellaceae bacterium]
MHDKARYAVIFTSQLSGEDSRGYGETASRMEQLAWRQAGFCGIRSVRDEAGLGITVSYWDSLEAICRWRDQAEHEMAQYYGRTRWYRDYQLQVTRIERQYKYPTGAGRG